MGQNWSIFITMESSVGQHWSRWSHAEILGSKKDSVTELTLRGMFAMYYFISSSQTKVPVPRGGNWSSKKWSNLAMVTRLSKVEPRFTWYTGLCDFANWVGLQVWWIKRSWGITGFSARFLQGTEEPCMGHTYTSGHCLGFGGDPIDRGLVGTHPLGRLIGR